MAGERVEGMGLYIIQLMQVSSVTIKFYNLIYVFPHSFIYHKEEGVAIRPFSCPTVKVKRLIFS